MPSKTISAPVSGLAPVALFTLTVALFALAAAGCGPGASGGGNGSPVDAGESADSGQTGNRDGGRPGTDGGRPGTDAGQPGTDAGQSGVDAGPGIDAGPFSPADHPALPMVVNSGGQVLANPQIVPVFFQDTVDAGVSVSNLASFYDGIGTSSFWSYVQEYGVGATSSVAPIVLSENAPSPIDDTGAKSALKNWLRTQLTNGVLPANTSGNMVYVLHFPQTATLTSGPWSISCASGSTGYHDAFTCNGAGGYCVYAVLLNCPWSNFTSEEEMTSIASHELVEAATDPFSTTVRGAWLHVDIPHMFWDEAFTESELADMCSADPQAYLYPSNFNFAIQRFWSNQAADAGHDPCVPPIADTYFGSVAELPDKTTLYDNNYPGVPNLVDAVHIPVGSSGTVTVDLYSDQPDSSWTVKLWDYNVFWLGQSSGPLTITPASQTGQNGDKLQFTITVNAASDGGLQSPNTELFVIDSSQTQNGRTVEHYGFGVVGN